MIRSTINSAESRLVTGMLDKRHHGDYNSGNSFSCVLKPSKGMPRFAVSYQRLSSISSVEDDEG